MWRFAAEVTIGDSGEEFFHILGDEVILNTRPWPWMISPYPIPLLKRGTHYSGRWIVMVYLEKIWCFKQTRFAGPIWGYQSVAKVKTLKSHHSVIIFITSGETWVVAKVPVGWSVKPYTVYPLNMWTHHLGWTMLRCCLTNLMFCCFWLVRMLVRSTILLFLAARGRWGRDLLKMDLLISAYLCAHLVRVASCHFPGWQVMIWWRSVQRCYSSTARKWCGC